MKAATKMVQAASLSMAGSLLIAIVQPWTFDDWQFWLIAAPLCFTTGIFAAYAVNEPRRN